MEQFMISCIMNPKVDWDRADLYLGDCKNGNENSCQLLTMTLTLGIGETQDASRQISKRSELRDWVLSEFRTKWVE